MLGPVAVKGKLGEMSRFARGGDEFNFRHVQSNGLSGHPSGDVQQQVGNPG